MLPSRQFGGHNTRLSRSQTQTQANGSEVRGGGQRQGHRVTTRITADGNCRATIQAFFVWVLVPQVSLLYENSSNVPLGLLHSISRLYNHKHLMKIKNNLLLVKKQVNTPTEHKDS